MIAACCGEKGFMAVTFWGFTDAHSWVDHFFGPDDPLLFDENYQPKPAYEGVRDALLVRRGQRTDRPVHLAVRICDAPILDGRLDEAVWRAAPPLVQMVRQDGSSSQFTTGSASLMTARPCTAVRALSRIRWVWWCIRISRSPSGTTTASGLHRSGTDGPSLHPALSMQSGTQLWFAATDAGAPTSVTATAGREQDAWTLE
jgi:hypothetical protein